MSKSLLREFVRHSLLLEADPPEEDAEQVSPKDVNQAALNAPNINANDYMKEINILLKDPVMNDAIDIYSNPSPVGIGRTSENVEPILKILKKAVDADVKYLNGVSGTVFPAALATVCVTITKSATWLGESKKFRNGQLLTEAGPDSLYTGFNNAIMKLIRSANKGEITPTNARQQAADLVSIIDSSTLSASNKTILKTMCVPDTIMTMAANAQGSNVAGSAVNDVTTRVAKINVAPPANADKSAKIIHVEDQKSNIKSAQAALARAKAYADRLPDGGARDQTLNSLENIATDLEGKAAVLKQVENDIYSFGSKLSRAYDWAVKELPRSATAVGEIAVAAEKFPVVGSIIKGSKWGGAVIVSIVVAVTILVCSGLLTYGSWSVWEGMPSRVVGTNANSLGDLFKSIFDSTTKSIKLVADELGEVGLGGALGQGTYKNVCSTMNSIADSIKAGNLKNTDLTALQTQLVAAIS